MKIIEKDGSKTDFDPKKHKKYSIRKTVEVTTTDKSASGGGKKKMVPEHMVAHLLKKGIILDPKKVKE